MLLKRSCHCTLLRCKAGNGKQLPIEYGRYNGPVQVVQKHRHECILSNCNQVGCTLGTTPRYLLLPRMHKTQKSSVSQGLYPILLLALSASTTSAYTSLGVSQDSNPQPQLLKASAYHSATSAVHSFIPRLVQEYDHGRNTIGQKTMMYFPSITCQQT